MNIETHHKNTEKEVQENETNVEFRAKIKTPPSLPLLLTIILLHTQTQKRILHC